MYRVVLSRRAEKALRALSPPHAQRVREALESFRDNPRIQGTVKLENTPVAQYRHRVGDYRLLFDIDESTGVVKVLDIRRRGERTYKWFAPLPGARVSGLGVRGASWPR